MKNVLSNGYAQGLSSHSSMQHSSAIFNQSEVFEVSSINKNSHKSSSKSDNFPDILNLNCRFCGRNNKNAQLFPVCKCNTKFLAHKKCVNGQAEGKCKKCGSKWLAEVSDFKFSPDIIADGSESGSKINESEGEIRMRNTIKAATEKPKCRICGEDNDSEDNKIIYPCQCHTLDYRMARAHRFCVLNTALYLQSDECENCKIKYSFAPVYRSIWVCSENDTFCGYLGECFKLLGIVGGCFGLAGFLFGLQDRYSDRSSLYVWSFVLKAAFLILGVMFFFVFLKVFVSVRSKVLVSLEVLCQKQEIARMSSDSQEYFKNYLNYAMKLGIVVDIPKVQVRDKVVKKNESLQPRIILELDTNGENIDSDMLREFSSPKLGESLHKSEDFKEEDINEHSISN